VSGATEQRPLRVLVAKLGLDGHDRGAKVVVHTLREAGMEVIYTGLRRSAAQVVAAAVDEDVDVIGLSILSGAHVRLVKNVFEELEKAEATDIPVVVGGTISGPDIKALETAGAAAVFPVRTPLDSLAEGVREAAGVA
jgi:methylmalonyl-CoA mutase C-terminal domain/subunit